MIVSKNKTYRLGGEDIQYKFSNNRGASVIRNQYSYGGCDGLWELAVLDKNGDIDYSTPITYDVIGYLTWEEVEQILKKIDELPEDK